ncbi:MAG: T9SS type A sorting domain-containing protein [Bacteroidota bacterium]|nr:T9SS type A sorting domain-containing protein [Bacteroidota bacterium]
MKKVVLFLSCFVFILNLSFAQTIPQGNVWVHSSSTPLNFGYFETATANYVFVDSIGFGDMIIHDNFVLAGKEDLFIYSAFDGQKLDSIVGANVSQLDMWGENIVVCRYTQPYFTVYSLSTLTEVFSLDTSKINFTGVDLLVKNNYAFLALDTFVQVIDLQAQDTLLRIQTEHPFPFGGFNRFLIELPASIFVDVEYATGAIRSSMIKIDPVSFTSEVLYHLEGGGNLIAPVPVGDTLFIMNHPSYYDIANDSLHVLPWSGNMKAVFNYDPVSNHLFIYDFLQNSIYAENLSYGDSVFSFFLNAFLSKAVFFPYTGTSGFIHSANTEIVSLFPQPAGNKLFLKINSPLAPKTELSIYSISGKLIRKIPAHESEKDIIKINLSNIPDGVYLVGIESQEIKSFRKIIIAR